MTGTKDRLRQLAVASGVLLLLAGGVGVAAHFSPLVSTTVTLIATFTPWFVGISALALVLLLAGGQRLLAGLAAVVLTVGLCTQLPLYRADGAAAAAAEAPRVRVMQANIRLGRADADAVVRTVRDVHVDVLTVAELTDDAVRRLAAAGLGQVLPHSFLRPGGGGRGSGIYSRHPLSDGASLPGFVLENVKTTMALPGAPPAVVYALHPLPPYPQPAWRWVGELRRLRALLAAEDHPLIIGADFNSTYDHRQFRRVLDGAAAPQLRDAAEYLGAGIVATYPADRWYPPLVAIDRILTRGGTPLSFRRVEIPGSDHHGVIGDVRLDGSVDIA